ncbi:MAG: hypothetical protein JXD18_09860 [Anaerolineae bacterium]|nr:hypothetical protein [Anaerolineae bacterium]
MSGVFGWVDSCAESPALPLKRMADALRLFEWAQAQTWAGAGVGLGQVNIGLFSTDPQPLHSEDGTLSGVFFGELYRPALPRGEGSEIAHIFRLYRERGDALLRDLEGVFVFALWDAARGHLLVANDRLGLIPTYYAHFDGRLVFAPQVKAILSDARFEKQLDLTAMAQFLRFQRLLGDRTFFEGVSLLPHGSLLRYVPAEDRLTVEHYWDFDQIPAWPAGATFEDAVVETGRLLRRAVEVRTGGEHRLGVYLSGGLDSRTLLALAAQIRPPVVSLTYGVPDCRDMYYARRIARRVGSPHHAFPLHDGRWVRGEVGLHLEITEGFVTWTHCHAAVTLRPGRELMDVNLSGFFGDQAVGARAIDHSPKAFGAVDALDFAVRMYDDFVNHYAWPGLTDAEERLLFSERFAPQLQGRAWASFLELTGHLNGCAPERKIDWLASLYQSGRLSNMNLVYQRAFFEARYPFCDYDLVDWVYAMPVDYRLNDRLYLEVMRREVPEVTWIPRDTDERLLVRPGFVRSAHGVYQKVRRRITGRTLRTIHEDPEGWLRHDLREWAEDVLLGERALGRGFYNPAFVRSLFERHMSGRQVHTIGQIAPLMTYEMMLRRFYDE